MTWAAVRFCAFYVAYGLFWLCLIWLVLFLFG